LAQHRFRPGRGHRFCWCWPATLWPGVGCLAATSPLVGRWPVGHFGEHRWGVAGGLGPTSITHPSGYRESFGPTGWR